MMHNGNVSSVINELLNEEEKELGKLFNNSTIDRQIVRKLQAANGQNDRLRVIESRTPEEKTFLKQNCYVKALKGLKNSIGKGLAFSGPTDEENFFKYLDSHGNELRSRYFDPIKNGFENPRLKKQMRKRKNSLSLSCSLKLSFDRLTSEYSFYPPLAANTQANDQMEEQSHAINLANDSNIVPSQPEAENNENDRVKVSEVDFEKEMSYNEDLPEIHWSPNHILNAFLD